MESVMEIGPVIAESLKSFLDQKANMKDIEKLSSMGVVVEEKGASKKRGCFDGKTICAYRNSLRIFPGRSEG